MAFLSLSISLSAPAPKTSLFTSLSPPSTLSTSFVASSETLSLLQPLNCLQTNRPSKLTRRRRRLWVVGMAPDEEKITRRSPLDFPMEWERPKPGRRADILPQFSPMKTPLPPPMPADPPKEDEEEGKKEEEEEEQEKEKEKEKEKEEEDPDKQE